MANQLVPSSSFSTTPSWTYDVFLSFRGDDTRYNFTDHLYHALVRHGIRTFIDHSELPIGEEISLTLLEAIENSRISVIIFSENYASSRWCLDELVHILKCKESKGQMTRPIFYKVDPSDVRHQRNSYDAAFADHSTKYDQEKVQIWREALTEAANLKGPTLNKGEYEATFINGVVEEISTQVLNRAYLHVPKYLVGIDSCLKEVEELLGVGGNDGRVVGIWGTSGIGKTTIAKAVYNAISHKFQGSCFLEDVKETFTSRAGVLQLQDTLRSEISRGSKWNDVNTQRGISLIENLVRGKKILLILDDVDRREQLDNLIEVDWFSEGCRVIITTKYRGLLESYGVKLIYNVQKLEDDEALELLSLNAFGKKEPSDDYLGLARRALAYAQGHPLALNLIGSYLRNKSIDRWQAVLDSYDSYNREPYTGIQKILRTSYDTLDEVMQQVFLDIACFFKGEDKDYVLQILRSLKLNVPQDCIEVLVENAIITIEDNRILMHDLLEKMGKHIVREESPTEPGERSRLWHHEDVYHVLTENKGTRKIKGIMVKLPKPDVIPLNAKSFLRMVNLEIFINCNARFSGCVDYLPNDLRWIELSKQEFQKSGFYILQEHTVTFNLQSNYHPRHLVTFDMQYSGIRQLKGFKNLAKLTSINLSYCEFLEKIPDLSGCPNIKKLDLDHCKSLVEVDDSVGFLDKLVFVFLRGCSKLTRFVTRLGCRSLVSLFLEGCTRLESLPKIEDTVESLTHLGIAETGIRELPSSILKLRLLNFGGSILTETDLLVHPNYWSTLLELDLSGSSFVSLPDCISKFVELSILHLNDCKRLREIPQVLPPKLKDLFLNDCTSLEKLPSKLPLMLRLLHLKNCFRLSGEEVEKLENNLLNQESLRWSGFEVFLPGNEVPKWFSYTSNHRTTIEHLPEDDDEELFVGGIEFSFEIPLNLQVGETLLGLALSCVVVHTSTYLKDFCILINGIKKNGIEETHVWLECFEPDIEETHVWLGLVDLDKLEQHGDICQVIFRFCKSVCIKSCGVQLLLRNQDERLPLSSGTTSSLGKRPRPHVSSDIVDDEYDEQQQWLSLSSKPTNDHSKRRQIDLNVPIDIEEEEEEQEQEQPSTSDDPQFLIY